MLKTIIFISVLILLAVLLIGPLTPHPVGLKEWFYPMTEERAILIVKENPHLFRKLPVEFKRNKNIVLAAISAESKIYRMVDVSLQKDKEIALATINKNLNMIFSLHKSLRKHKGFILDILKVDGIEYYLEFIDKSLFKDEYFVNEAIRRKPLTIKFASQAIKNNKEIVLRVIKHNGELLRYASERLKNDKQILLVAMMKSDGAFVYRGESLREDRDLSLIAVMRNGCLLSHVDKLQKNDKEIILKALGSGCTYDGFFRRTIDKLLLKDEDIALAIIQNTMLGGIRLHPSVTKNKSFVRKAFKQNVFLGLYYMHPSLRKDKKIIIEAFRIVDNIFKEGYTFFTSKDDILQSADPSIRQEVKTELGW